MPGDPRAQIREYLIEQGIAFETTESGDFAAVLPGDAKLRTTVSIAVGDHSVVLNAFVARRPDENHEGVYRWLLERNARMGAASYCLDRLGDVYLVARIPLDSFSITALDGALGTVLVHADGDFNRILELGFASSIVKEWRWRLRRGESVANLAAFGHLRPRDADAVVPAADDAVAAADDAVPAADDAVVPADEGQGPNSAG